MLLVIKPQHLVFQYQLSFCSYRCMYDSLYHVTLVHFHKTPQSVVRTLDQCTHMHTYTNAQLFKVLALLHNNLHTTKCGKQLDFFPIWQVIGSVPLDIRCLSNASIYSIRLIAFSWTHNYKFLHVQSKFTCRAHTGAPVASQTSLAHWTWPRQGCQSRCSGPSQRWQKEQLEKWHHLQHQQPGRTTSYAIIYTQHRVTDVKARTDLMSFSTLIFLTKLSLPTVLLLCPPSDWDGAYSI